MRAAPAVALLVLLAARARSEEPAGPRLALGGEASFSYSNEDEGYFNNAIRSQPAAPRSAGPAGLASPRRALGGCRGPAQREPRCTPRLRAVPALPAIPGTRARPPGRPHPSRVRLRPAPALRPGQPARVLAAHVAG